ncbi:hypothetical protein BJX70DRAFT_362897 [Aspergillus crustosus]
MMSNAELWEKTLYMLKDGEERNAAVSNNPRKFRDRQELLLRSDTDTYEDSDLDYDFLEHNANEYKEIASYPLPSSEPVNPVPFTDHTGKIAYMVLKQGTLPPLYSFSIYFTHPHSTPSNTDLKALAHELTPEDLQIRYDIYFLPSVSAEDCVSHYEGEKAVRGSYKAQIKSLRASPRDEVRPLPGTTGQLPGMVNRYLNISPYRALLYLSPDEDWREGLVQVSFNRKSIVDETQYGEQGPPPPVELTSRIPLNEDDPAFINDSNPDTPISERIYDHAYRVADIYHTSWQRAMVR